MTDAMQVKEALLPCPFCGGTASMSTGKHADGSPWDYIECETFGCGAIAEPDIWNTRAPSPAPTGNAPEPVAWTNSEQLRFLKDPLYHDIPMAMWGQKSAKGEVQLYAAPASNPQEAVEIDDGSYTDDPGLADRVSSTDKVKP